MFSLQNVTSLMVNIQSQSYMSLHFLLDKFTLYMYFSLLYLWRPDLKQHRNDTLFRNLFGDKCNKAYMTATLQTQNKKCNVAFLYTLHC